MNVFEFLGLSKTHRTGKHIVQHVKNADEVPESKKTYPVWGQIKKDGVYALVVKRCLGGVSIFGRSGLKYTNCEELEAKFSESKAPMGVYIAELCCDVCSLEQLSGIVNPNRQKELDHAQKVSKAVMYLAFHDMLSIEEFIEGISYRSYQDRFNVLTVKLPASFSTIMTHVLNTKEDEDKFFNAAISDAEEGMVIKNPAEAWVAGHKGYRQYKRVRGVSYDLRCIGAEEGTGKMKGKVGNLIFKWKGDKKIKCPLGKGWTHEDASDMYMSFIFGSHDIRDHPVSQIFEVYALQESSKGKLRMPKVGELRHDKTEPDVGE